MPENSCAVQLPENLGARLRVLFCLVSAPETLTELGELIHEHNRQCLEDPRLSADFQAIYRGRKIFGDVDYETRHRVKLASGKQAYVACALDALVEGFFLPIEIDSSCFHCGQPIRIRMSGGIVNYIEPSSTVIWLGACKEGMGSCCSNLCPYTNFFSSPKHLAEWKHKNPNELGIMLALKQGLELARKGWWEPIRLTQAKT